MDSSVVAAVVVAAGALAAAGVSLGVEARRRIPSWSIPYFPNREWAKWRQAFRENLGAVALSDPEVAARIALSGAIFDETQNQVRVLRAELESSRDTNETLRRLIEKNIELVQAQRSAALAVGLAIPSEEAEAHRAFVELNRRLVQELLQARQDSLAIIGETLEKQLQALGDELDEARRLSGGVADGE